MMSVYWIKIKCFFSNKNNNDNNNNSVSCISGFSNSVATKQTSRVYNFLYGQNQSLKKIVCFSSLKV